MHLKKVLFAAALVLSQAVALDAAQLIPTDTLKRSDAPMMNLRPIRRDELFHGLGKRSEVLEARDLTRLVPKEQEQFHYGLHQGSSYKGDRIFLADMKLTAPAGKKLVSLENIDGMLKGSVDCSFSDDSTGKITLHFDGRDVFNAARSWEGEGKDLIFVTSHLGCGKIDERSAFASTKIEFNKKALTATIYGSQVEWSTVTGTYTLDFGTVEGPHGLRARDLFPRLDIGGLGGDLTSAFGDATSAVAGAATSAAAAVTSEAAVATSAAGGAVSQITSEAAAVTSAAGQAASQVTSAAAAATSSSDSIWDSIKDKFKDMDTWIDSLSDNVKDKIDTYNDNVKDKLKNAAEQFAKDGKNFEDIFDAAQAKLGDEFQDVVEQLDDLGTGTFDKSGSDAGVIDLNKGSPNNSIPVYEDPLHPDDPKQVINCIDCWMKGKLLLSGHLDFEDFLPKNASFEVAPQDFSANIKFQVLMKKNDDDNGDGKPDPLTITMNLFTFASIPGLSIPHIFELGPTAGFAVALNSTVLSDADFAFGMNATLPNDAVWHKDLLNQDAEDSNGFDKAELQSLPFELNEGQLDIDFSVAPELKIAIGVSVAGIMGYEAAIVFKIPKYEAQVSTVNNDKGACEDGGPTTGVVVDSTTTFEIVALAGESVSINANNKQIELFSHVLDKGSKCYPIVCTGDCSGEDDTEAGSETDPTEEDVAPEESTEVPAESESVVSPDSSTEVAAETTAEEVAPVLGSVVPAVSK